MPIAGNRALLAIARLLVVLFILFIDGVALLFRQVSWEAIGSDASENISAADYAILMQHELRDWRISGIWFWLIFIDVNLLLLWLAFKKYSPAPRVPRRPTS